ncbi:amino acid adenylation domain-containing protein [Arhodomonas sp. AD133]|uniref:amino acid adenylation domain-containing protein n=1 Tax=Arhodomonas sp. AD133 TaxID=3415009 RepID=UPI003EBB70D8
MDEKRRLLLSLLSRMPAPVPKRDGIAIVGVAGRYPLAETVTDFWENLAAGRHCIREVPGARWNAGAHYDPSGTRGSYSKWAGFVDDVDKFDPLFFQISPADAEAMDPQERLFLETAAAVLDDAACPAARLAAKGPVGVFAGVMNSNYEWMGGDAAARGAHNDAHSNFWSIANRVSYTFDFTGPSLAVDTACSASLTAIHLACESLHSGECTAAIAGGVNLILHPMHLRMLAQRGMVSHDDRLKSFGADADGFVDGEGVGAVLLKPLASAVADGDRILGVIRGTAINSGGKTGGYTVPNADAQSRVIRSAMERAGVTPEAIGYVETHGTGTPLGDPIEIAGLTEAFGGRIDPSQRSERPTVPIASVKSNIGHLESAAGVAGLTKVLMQFRHGMLAPSLNATRLNPNIDFSTTRFQVQQTLAPWPRLRQTGADGETDELPRRAIVSSFGGGGANACLIAEEYAPVAETRSRTADGPQLLVLSAKTEERLNAYAARLARFLQTHAGRAPQVDAGALSEAQRVCTEVAARILGVDTDALDPEARFEDCGFGIAERANLLSELTIQLDRELPASAAQADSIAAVARLIATAEGEPADETLRLADIAHTLQTGRTAYEHRMALVAGSVSEAVEHLQAFTEGAGADPVITGRAMRAQPQLSDQDASALETAVQTRDLPAIARRWVAGAPVDWSRVCPADARRIELPTYPFARERYWIPEPPADSSPDHAPPSAINDGPEQPAVSVPDFYRPIWVRDRTRAEPAGTAKRIVALVTSASTWLGEAIAARAGDADVALVRVDELPVDTWLAEARGADLVLHLGAVGHRITEGVGIAQVDAHTRQGSLALFRLLRESGVKRVGVVTNDAHPVAGYPVVNPFAAGLHGLLQVAPKERADLRVAGVDVSLSDLADDAATYAAADTILREALAGTGRTVALRAGVRYARRLGQVGLPDADPVFRDRGVYLMVGGTGGIARELSLHLARVHRAHLVWLSRREPGPEQQATVREVQRLGGEVLHVQGDACDAEDVANAVAQARARFGTLHGAIHAAMVFDNHTLAELDEPAFEAATRVKIQGAVALAAATANEPLDFLTYFSSAGSFGSFAGNGAYICASASEDAYGAFLRARLPFPVVVINQGYWGGVGSGAQAGLAEIFEGLGIQAFSVAEGIAGMERILASGLGQVMPIRASRRALEAMGHDPALDGELLDGGHAPSLARVAPGLVETTSADDAARQVLAGYDELEAASAPMLLGVYQRMGVFLAPGERHDLHDLRARLGIVEKFQRLHDALLRILESAGYLRVEDGFVGTTNAVDSIDASVQSDAWEAALDRIAAAYPDIEPTVTLNRHFLRDYPRILRGEVGATEIMFPDSSMERVQNFYKGNGLTDRCNLGVRDAVRGFLDAHPARRSGSPLHVVELGAGTGATSERVLPVLAEQPGRVSYTFTDVSPRFLEYGRERFQTQYPFTRFQVLNLDRGLDEQGFAPASADVVVATNVVHATRNLRATLRKAKALLAPGGWLILNELTAVRPLLTIGGGVLEGWWAFEDGELRMADSPLASPDMWTRLLCEEGFHEVHLLGQGDGDFGQTVFVAESDGVVAHQTPQDVAAPANQPPQADVPAGGGVEERLRELVERVLKLNHRIDPDRPLADYGFDSLSGMKIVSAVDEAFGVTVPLGAFFEHPTLKELATHLADNWLADVAAPPETAAASPASASETGTGAAMPAPARTAVATTARAEPAGGQGAAAVAPTVLRPRNGGETDSHPLSEGQRALWVIEQIAPGNYAYNLPLAFWLAHDVDVLALRVALQALVDRHEALRATVRDDHDGPRMHIAAEPELPFQQVYLTTVSEHELRDRMRAELRRPFDLATGPLIRATLYSMGDGRQALLLTFHHMIFDGLSIDLILEELERGYAAARQGNEPATEAPRSRYADFVAAQQAMLAGDEGERLRNYWTERLQGRATVMPLPFDRPRPAVPGFRGASLDGHIPARVIERARALAKSEQTSLFGVLIAAYFALLSRYTDQRDVAVGTPTSGRPPGAYEDALGYFMNMVVLAEHVEDEEPFRALVRRLHRCVLAALDHSALPLISVADALQRAQPGSPSTPFNVAFYFQNWVDTGPRDGLVRDAVEGVHQEGEFDLTLEVVEQAQGCRYTLKYDPDLFDESTVERMGEHFTALLDGAVAAADTAVADLDLLTAEERAWLAPPSAQAYPADTQVWQLVHQQAQARPEAVAVRFGDDQLSYRELDERVAALAARLRAAGVGRGRTVGVLLPRGLALPEALLAVQAAGGIYVPLDPSYPEDRLEYMAEDAGLHLLLTHSSLPGDHGIRLPRLYVDGGESAPPAPSPGVSTAQDTAYVIYTSGSTGRPKGVRVAHRSLINFLWSMAREPGFGPRDTLLALTTICFDISALELYLPLITGGTVEVLPTDTVRDGIRLREAVETSQPTVMQATPATWRMLLAAGWPGSPALTVLCGGEALPGDLADELLAGNREVWNLYGPTETTIWSAVARLRRGERVTLGNPIANTSLYVLDSHRRPVPTGVPGELYIGGDGVAQGYLNRPDLTAERFVSDPFATEPGARMYRTGDLVRRLPDGALDYLGRIDSQVKVRGFRVELEEIEAALRRLAGVREAVAVARPDSGGSHSLLACYELAEGAAEPTHEQLSRWLPEHMVPDALVRVSSLPRTLNQKADRTALASLPLDELRRRFGVAAATKPEPGPAVTDPDGGVEALVADLGERVARLADLDPGHVDPRAPLGELGMNSVSFTALSAELSEAYTITVEPTLFYRRGTVLGLAQYLREHHPDAIPAGFRAAPPAPPAAPDPEPAAAPASEHGSNDIAIIGMAGRLPGSRDLNEFWEHLTAGHDLVSEIPAERWDWRAETGSRSRWGGFAPDVDCFDAGFFGISPREAELMDPQQRLMLELAWAAIENAGYRPSELADERVGVFIAVTNSDYLEVQRAAGRGTEGHTITGAALSIVANRVSYTLDLHGPSIAVDTACSGSLTAIHQACAALRDGTCDLALAGGVSLILSPTLYEALSRGEMLSPDGRCKAFDSRADGYVRGEGAGIVLLKPGDRADRDGDAVHGLIKSITVNHGGRTTSLTAPNPDAQTDLLVDAYRQAAIPLESVGYIEAHGTGTALGDPIETAGLSAAFERLREETTGPAEARCAIGSVKTNIGHLEAAAGIAGLFKATLAMQHGTIPASLHFREANPYLSLDGTPFEVAERTRPWPRPHTREGEEHPRRAGVSSFGFGGANAHVVLEEAGPRPVSQETPGDQLIVLSARDPDALRRSAEQLVAHLEHDEPPLADLAFTLQVGREAMAHRLAVIAADIGALRTALADYLAGRECAVRTAKVNRRLAPADAADVTGPEEAMDVWLGGAEIDWHALHDGQARRRLHLPSYPFARIRHWITPDKAHVPPAPGSDAPLHPTLLDADASTAQAQVYRKRLRGDEFFLADHVVGDRPMLPGVALLEMARLAGETASPGTRLRRIDDLVWATPVQPASDDDATALLVHIRGEGTDTSFEITSATDEARTHASGTLRFGEPGERPAAIDLAAIRTRCGQVHEGSRCYAAFERMGFAYGTSFRVIETLAEGEREVLAALRLPASRTADAGDYVFHPSLFDAALQTAGWLALATGDGESDATYFPFSLGSVRVFAELPEALHAYATPSRQPAAPDSIVFDVLLVDGDGHAVAAIDAFTLRARTASEEIHAFEPTFEPAPAAAEPVQGDVLLLDGGTEPEGTAVRAALEATGVTVHTLTPGADFDAEYALERVGQIAHVVHLPGAATDDDAPEHDWRVAMAVLQAWLNDRRGALRYLFAHTGTEAAPAHGAMAAFARAVGMEEPELQMSTLQVEAGSLAPAVVQALGTAGTGEIRIAPTGRQRRTFQSMPLPAATRSPFLGDGAHVITGGTGGLGLRLAEHVAAVRRSASAAKGGIVLLARKEPAPAIRARVEAMGAELVRVDVTDATKLRAVLDDLRHRFGCVRGIIHTAGVLKDGLLRQKRPEDADAVLAAKVRGTIALDEATRSDPLDYFVLFSSAASVFGNAGQTDYAYANGFLDHFAERRERQRVRGSRNGRTLSAAWPVWAEGGMRVDADTERAMARELGMRPVPTAAGIAALERALAGTSPWLLLTPGEPSRVLAALTDQAGRAERSGSAAKAGPAPAQVTHALSADDARAWTEQLVVSVLAEEVKLPEADIGLDEPFDDYGVDSLITMRFVRRLEEHFGPLSKTLLFEHVTARELIDYLVSAYPDAFAEHHEAAAATETTGDASSGADSPAAAVAEPGREVVNQPADHSDDIAIIGVAGRYPQADDVNEFWRNLREGLDSIEEIPRERWNHDIFYDPDKSAPGKSYSKWGGFVRGADRFDPMFFRMSQIEAEHIDPQERVFLETTWHVLEDAGYTRERLRGSRTGVFVGMMYGHYQLYGVQDALRGDGIATSSSYASVANRVSYFFNFTGPSVALDTMCSSSLVTVHQACLAIRNGDCDVAVAGGVNISSHPLKYLQLAQRGFLSEDGRCRSFGEGGTGYVPGEGSGAVLLKRLDQALADGDRVLAVVKASAVNHGGASKGYSVPNPKAQGDLVRHALSKGGLNPGDLDYFEAHGTGTSLGDPVEITGMLRAFEGNLPERLPIGSVKSNIGHAESAAGIAAITKVLMQMRHGELVPSLHAEQLNPNINLDETPFQLQRELAPWPRRVSDDGAPLPRTAGISSFGAGGTNAHLVLQEYPGGADERPRDRESGPQLAVLSAKDAERLQVQAQRLAAHLRSEGSDAAREAVAWTLQWGREAMSHRVAVRFETLPELADALTEVAEGKTPPGTWSGVVDVRKPAAGETPEATPEAYAQAWTSGQSVDWAALHPWGRPDRVSLPGYPFLGERIWIAAADAELDALDTTGEARGMLLTRAWEPATDAPATATPRRTVILTVPGAEALADALAGALPASTVVTHEELLATLKAGEDQWESVDALIDLSGCADRTTADAHDALPGWITWMQHAVDRQREGLSAILVSRRDANGAIPPAGAARAGLYRMLQSEYRHVRSRHVTVESDTSDDQLCRWVAQELGLASDVSEVLYRDRTRHTAVLREQPATAGSRLDFPRDHVLWVTGGTRGIGLRTAQHFVERHGVRKLVLTGREPLPPRSEWPAHVADDTALGRKLRPLAELVEQGVEVEVLSVPLQDTAALSDALARVKQRLGPVGGVIHGAGFTDFDNPAFVRKTQAGIARVLEPKVSGLDALVECFRDEPLHFFILFSSVAAAVPALAVGQSDYALANAYMDAVARARPHGLPLISVQWPSWKESGMGEVQSAAYRASGLGTLSDADGLALLERAIASGERVVLPALPAPDADWHPERLTSRRLVAAQRKPRTGAQPDTGVDTGGRAAASEAPQPAEGHTEAAGAQPPSSESMQSAVTALSEWMLEELARELGFDRAKLAGDVPVEDYGIDSILVSQLVQNVGKRLDVSVDPSALLEYPTVDEFTNYIAEQHGDALISAFAAEQPQAGTTSSPGASSPAREGPAAVDERPPASAAEPAPTGDTVTSPEDSGVDTARARRSSGDVAVVGLSARFAGAESADEFWRLLREGRSALRPIPEHMFHQEYPYHAGLLPDVLRFDPDYFSLSEEDVRAMDPQALLLLEEVDGALHDAGYDPAELKGRSVGVYVGGRTTYQPDPERLEHARNPVVATGQNYLAANISQFFDFCGPSLVIDTACSSALVAMDLAVQALQAGDIEVAVVAGVNLLADGRAHMVFGRRGLLNPGTEFHVFDQRAAGLIPGEGAGVVVLRALPEAQADGDRVLAVLHGIAVNNDGRTAGPATPNLQAQRAVMKKALARSGRNPADVAWLEANASGTGVTDLLELKAVSELYGGGSQPLALGSMKPNIGHPLAAEGIAAFIKVVLMLQHGEGVPFTSGQQPLEHFDMTRSPLYFPREPQPWPGTTALAAINCFGDGGTNAHVILGSAPEGYVSKRSALPLRALDRRVVLRGPAETPAVSPQPFWETYRSEPSAASAEAAAARETLFWERYEISASDSAGSANLWNIPDGRSQRSTGETSGLQPAPEVEVAE